MKEIWYAFLGTMFPFAITILGALQVFWMKKAGDRSGHCAMLGFAGGVMTAASIWSLILPAIEEAENNGQISWLVVALSFLAGVIFLLLFDLFWANESAVQGGCKEICETKGTLSHCGRMMILAITLHNIPEGMTVGLAFALAARNPEDPALWSGACILALGIGIQNYPEGAAVSMPLAQSGVDRRKAFLAGAMSGAVEPVAGVLAALLAHIIAGYMAVFLAFAAGTMIYVVVEELIPEAHPEEKNKKGTLGFVVGFLIMMILDVALGG